MRTLTGLLGKGMLAAGAGLMGALYLYGTFRRRAPYDMVNVPAADDPRFLLTVIGLSDSMSAIGDVTGFWVEADAIWRARLKAIRRAKRSIHFETFYMTPGRRADDFAEALIARRKAGVEVRLIVDVAGSNRMPQSYWKRLEDADIELHRFRPFDWHSPMDYLARTHRKLLLVDGEKAYIGGAGVSDDWDGKPEIGDKRPWRDLEIRLEGPVVGVLEGGFMQNWLCEGGTLDMEASAYRGASRQQGALAVPVGTLAEQKRTQPDRTIVITSGSFSIDNSGPAMLYQTSIEASGKRVWIATPYFAPDDTTTDRLLEAARRGVDVRVVTMGPCNDRPFVRWAAHALYGPFLEAGVRIYEYSPAMLHAKVLLVDECWVSTGSANFDHLSFFHNDELNVSTTDPQLVQAVSDFLEETFADSCEFDFEGWRARRMHERLRDSACSGLRRIY